MASFRCRAYGREGTFEYDGRRACPHCGTHHVQFALSIDELTDNDPLVVAMNNLAEETDSKG